MVALFFSQNLMTISLAKSLIMSLLQINPKLRYTVQDALEHPWIRKRQETIEKIYAHRILKRSACGDAPWMTEIAVRHKVIVPAVQGSVVEDARTPEAGRAILQLNKKSAVLEMEDKMRRDRPGTPAKRIGSGEEHYPTPLRHNNANKRVKYDE